MTLIELMRMLRTHLKQIVVIPVVVAVAVFVVYLGKSSAYSATAKMVTYGGSFASVSGLADMVASQASTDDIKVASAATSSSNTIAITAKGADETKAIAAANEAVSTLSQTARDKQAANETTIEAADEATRSSKNPLVYAAGGWMGALFFVVLFYMLADLVRPRVHGFELVETMGLTYLGSVENDPAKLRLALANIELSGMGDGKRAKKVRLLPAGSGVRASDAARLLLSAAGGSARLALAASLEESPDVLFRCGSGESLVIVVEQEVTTVADLEEIRHELGIAKIEPRASCTCLTRRSPSVPRARPPRGPSRASRRLPLTSRRPGMRPRGTPTSSPLRAPARAATPSAGPCPSAPAARPWLLRHRLATISRLTLLHL